ncbi:MAG: hypothetical protein QNJ45_22380 [Ardenticatenaceae bacterium]|nr:hypothetical protein [Ardenticatenaceae bacterium]
MSKIPKGIEPPNLILQNPDRFEPFPPPGFVPAESTVDGIDIWIPAPEGHDEKQKVVEFKCPRCAGESAFSAESGVLECRYCGYQERPEVEVVGRSAEEQEFRVATLDAVKSGWGVERTEVVCQSCGTHETVPAGELTHTCPFCGSNRVVEAEIPTAVLRPSALIPIEVDQAHLETILNEWFTDHWLLPNQLKNVVAAVNMQQVFIPFWTFDAQSYATWKAQVGHTRTVGSGKNRRTKTVWRWESGRVSRFFDDYLVSGSKRLNEKLLDKIDSFNLQGLVPYDPSFLAGSAAQAYEIELEQAWSIGRTHFREAVRKDCRRQASSPRIRNFSMNLDFSDESWRYILLPVLMASYRFNNKIYRIIINGQTGSIFGQRPIDWGKIRSTGLMAMVPSLIAVAILLVGLAIGNQEVVSISINLAVGFLIVGLIAIGIVIAMGIYLQKDWWSDEFAGPEGADE